jgi:Tfp pilus assembly protein PilV
LLTNHLKNEAGYSLVEVMVAIILLTIAIIPMVGMFDMSLKSASKGSSYDQARTLANLKLEQAKRLPFDSSDAAIQDVKDNFPEAAGTTTSYNGAGCYCGGPSPWKTEPGANFSGFEYQIEKQYMAQPPTNPASSEDFSPSSTATDLINVRVNVRWGDNNTYTTSGLVTK